MNCKYCGAELEEGSTLCPVCGKDNAVAEEQETVLEEMVTEEKISESIGEEVEDTAEVSDCGEPAADPEVKTGAKLSPGKIALIVVAAVALVAVLVSVIVFGLKDNDDKDKLPSDHVSTTASTEESLPEATVPADGNADDETCKGSYTVTDEEAAAANSVVVATMGDKELTNGELQIYYWMQVYEYVDYVAKYNLETNVNFALPFDIQSHPDGGTWQQFFLKMALQTWQRDRGLTNEFENNGMEMDANYVDTLKNMEDILDKKAKENGFEDGLAMIQSDMGKGCTMENYHDYMELYYKGYSYYQAEADKITVDHSELEAYYAENKEEYAKYGVEEDTKLIDVRHILVLPEGGTQDMNGETVYTDKELEACKAKAQEILDEWKAGDMTEDSFAELAGQYSQDPGSKDKGGLYTEVRAGMMLPEFNDWCFDDARAVGDTGLVQTRHGYHVMYFSGSHLAWEKYAELDVTSEKQSKIFEAVQGAYPIEVDYSAIVLAASAQSK